MRHRAPCDTVSQRQPWEVQGRYRHEEGQRRGGHAPARPPDENNSEKPALSQASCATQTPARWHSKRKRVSSRSSWLRHPSFIWCESAHSASPSHARLFASPVRTSHTVDRESPTHPTWRSENLGRHATTCKTDPTALCSAPCPTITMRSACGGPSTFMRAGPLRMCVTAMIRYAAHPRCQSCFAGSS